MALRLQTQQVELVATNQQLDDRRRFTELVLSGVSAGVIGLNEKGEIDLPNRSASELLGRNLMQHVGQPLGELVPEMGELVTQAQSRPAGTAEGQINMSHGALTRTLHVRVVSERSEGDHTRIVVTFDDVTELLSAQRKAAWSDIARRIAHEIKNPLTPIQLSAERLKRKYLKEIINDPETFAVCTDTIVRQVGDIGRMVDEFSSFARMPAPVLRPGGPGGAVAPGRLPAAERQRQHRLRRGSAGGADLGQLRRLADHPGADQPAAECRGRDRGAARGGAGRVRRRRTESLDAGSHPSMDSARWRSA